MAEKKEEKLQKADQVLPMKQQENPLPAEKPAGFMQATKDFFGNALSTVKGKDLSTLTKRNSAFRSKKFPMPPLPRMRASKPWKPV